jgi:hypothetical protein
LFYEKKVTVIRFILVFLSQKIIISAIFQLDDFSIGAHYGGAGKQCLPGGNQLQVPCGLRYHNNKTGHPG